MKNISQRAAAVHPSSTLAVNDLANKLRAAGEDVINFGAGEPDFDTPDNIRMASIRAICEGKTRYTPASGLPALKDAVCNRLKLDLGLDYAPEQIVAASGAKHSIFVALSCLLDPGDEVIIPAPFWVTYPEAVSMVGGVPVILPTTEENGFKLQPEVLEAAITPKTKLFMLNNPCNPTGMYYNKEELSVLCEICAKHDLWILSDEIYNSLLYDQRKFTSVAALGEDIRERTVLINGVSKSYAMTGWRIGYSASSTRLAKVMSNFLSHSTSAPATISQYAAIEALTGSQNSIIDMRAVFESRRNVMASRINAIPGVHCLVPEGAFYVMMNIEKLLGRTLGGRHIENGDDFALALLASEKVALVPCSGFGAPNYVRWTYATSTENINRGIDRLEHFLSNV